MPAVHYVREHCIEQQIELFIGQVVHERPLDPYGVIANQFAGKSHPPTIAQLKGSEIIISTGRLSLNVDVFASMLGRNKLVGSGQAPFVTSVFTQEQKNIS
jgi:hypothetical protein